MKFLYVSSVSKSRQYSGILKKVAGQTKGVSELGWDAFYTCMEGDSVTLCKGDDTLQRETFPGGLRWRDRQKTVADKICGFVENGKYDAVYIKGFLASPYACKIAACAKKSNQKCRVIFEIATYPYWGTWLQLLKTDFKDHQLRSFLGHLFEISQHITSMPQMKRNVDMLAVFGKPVKRLWKIPCVMLDNGITFTDFHSKTYRYAKDGIHILGVVGTTLSHGYSRVLNGIAKYKDQGGFAKMPVYFDIVGGNDTIKELKSEVLKLQIAQNVSFLGYKNSKELQQLYDYCDIAVSVLGGFSYHLNYMSPIKSREYCAAGMPFLYAYEDTLPPDAPFAMKIPNNSSPVNIGDVVKFAENCRRNPEISVKERQYAESHYDWKIIMKRVLDFAGADDKE